MTQLIQTLDDNTKRNMRSNLLVSFLASPNYKFYDMDQLNADVAHAIEFIWSGNVAASGITLNG